MEQLQWLKRFERVKIGKKTTFDASATPELGQKLIKVQSLSELDVRELVTALAPPPAKSREPVKPVGGAGSGTGSAGSAVIVGSDPKDKKLEELETRCAALARDVQSLHHKLTISERALEAIESILAKYDERSKVESQIAQPPVQPARARDPSTPVRAASVARSATDPSGPKAGALRMLRVIVSNLQPMTKTQIATASGMRVTSGTFSTYWSTLKTNGFIEQCRDGDFRSTIEGGQYLETVGGRATLIETFEDRVRAWTGVLKGSSRRMLEVVIEAHPHPISRDRLGHVLGMSPTSGTFSTYLSLLTSNRLVIKSGTEGYAVHPWLRGD